MAKKRRCIAVDFDGTVVVHAYPNVGRSVDGAEEILKELVDAGHLLILLTMRSGKELQDAEQWFVERGIPLWNINLNPDQDSWSTSKKVWAHVYIDDCAAGVLLKSEFPDERPFVDWIHIREWLVENGVLD